MSRSCGVPRHSARSSSSRIEGIGRRRLNPACDRRNSLPLFIIEIKHQIILEAGWPDRRIDPAGPPLPL
jgi:hypothetical protein